MTRYERFNKIIVEKIEYEVEVTMNNHKSRNNFDLRNCRYEPDQKHRITEQHAIFSNIREKTSIKKFGLQVP